MAPCCQVMETPRSLGGCCWPSWSGGRTQGHASAFLALASVLIPPPLLRSARRPCFRLTTPPTIAVSFFALGRQDCMARALRIADLERRRGLPRMRTRGATERRRAAAGRRRIGQRRLGPRLSGSANGRRNVAAKPWLLVLRGSTGAWHTRTTPVCWPKRACWRSKQCSRSSGAARSPWCGGRRRSPWRPLAKWTHVSLGLAPLARRLRSAFRTIRHVCVLQSST
mmetsp:Transcript_69751/g.149252  ORF Transcript_69751/g.149252 Transcript_69751/m.149252 type:complete len:225 (-) Transcript_69751:2318-2992(-)